MFEALAFSAKSFGFGLDSVGTERGPLAVDRGAAEIEHGLGAVDCPTHARPFHAILHQMATRSLDHAAGDRVTCLEVFVVTHAVAIAVEVVADSLQCLLLVRRQFAFRSPLPQAADYVGHFAVQKSQYPVAY